MSGENFEKNKVLREELEVIAEKKKCSLNQLALAWVLHKGNDVVPIPGTTKKANLESNIGAVAVALSKEEIAEIEAAVPIDGVAGGVTSPAFLHLSRHYALSPPVSSWKEGI
jgi:aryl-alcohol dehydrogenase-like predicted oxidoreductase